MAFGVRQYTQAASAFSEQRFNNYLERGLRLRRERTARIQARLAGLKQTASKGTL